MAEARARDPHLSFDLSGAELKGLDLTELDLSSSNFHSANLVDCRLQNTKLIAVDLSGARLHEANFHGANLAGADFSNASFFRCLFDKADLRGAKVTSHTTFKESSLGNAIFDNKTLFQANIAEAVFSGCNLSGIDLSDCDLHGIRFEQANLTNVNFSNSNLTEAKFSYSRHSHTVFTGANLMRASFRGAKLHASILVSADLSNADLQDADLTAAAIYGANFYEAILTQACFRKVVGAYRAKNLRTTILERDVRYFDKVVRAWPERWADWEIMRIAGRLPLFGASYSALIVIPTYLYALGIYNDKIKAAKVWIEASGANASQAILNHLHEEPIPSKWKLLLISTFLLAIASTIYALACPSRVKSFSRDQWCDEQRHSLIHYWADAWKLRPLRLACAVMYSLGGTGALYVLITKLWWAGTILFGSPSDFF